MTDKKVVVAMSGGVDSSVAAALLKSEYDVVGVTLKLFSNQDIELDATKSCCSLDDVEDARSVARRLGIEHFVYNFGDRFKEHVIDRFNAAYIRGDTPNPCIDCNRFIKFNALLQRAFLLGCNYVATGHYVRRVFDEKSGRFLLKKGADSSKDQSYVLYGLTQEQLSHTLFPLGEYTKQQIRELAEKFEFINADKPDSQDICFVPDGDYATFIEKYTGKQFEHGKFVHTSGEVLGEHQGIIRYTVGQRKGLGISYKEPLFVIEKDVKENTITLGKNEDLFFPAFAVEDVNWISGVIPTEPFDVKVKTRYHQQEQPATIYPLSDNKLYIELNLPQRAVTTGQAAVFYDEDTVLGGGTICKVFRECLTDKGESIW